MGAVAVVETQHENSTEMYSRQNFSSSGLSA